LWQCPFLRPPLEKDAQQPDAVFVLEFFADLLSFFLCEETLFDSVSSTDIRTCFSFCSFLLEIFDDQLHWPFQVSVQQEEAFLPIGYLVFYFFEETSM